MKLYEVNREIQNLLMQLEPDPETGEIPDNADTILDQLNSLALERSEILEYLAKVVLDLRADTLALKNEEQRLKERRSAIERKEERLMQILDRECAGQKTDCGVATVSYRKTNRVEVVDAAGAISWLVASGHRECYRTPPIEIAKNEVKRLIQAGAIVPGVKLVQDLSCSLK